MHGVACFSMVLNDHIVALRVRWRLLCAAAPLALLLAACGGGLSIGIGIDGSGDFAVPSVNLVAAQSSVQAGQNLRLVAAAADENGIESVAFFRRDNGGAVLLGTDRSEPFELQTLAPADGRASMTVFARATDGAGNQADSASVQIAITP
jgi:Bacterial Ig domain